MENVGLIPLWNFGEVAPKLFRSAQPLYAFQYDWLHRILDVSKIYNLRAESRHDERTAGDEIEVVNVNVKDHFPPTFMDAVNFMTAVKHDREKGIATLIHCEHGHGRTSTFSILAKMALGDSLEQAIEDEKERFHFEFRHHAQEQWLKDNFGGGEIKSNS